MATAIDALDRTIREELPQVMHESLPEVAPNFKYIESTSMQVKRDKGIGRGWKVIHLYATGVAGLMEYAAPGGPDVSSDPTIQSWLLAQGDAAANLAPFPTATESPHTGSIKRELSLHLMTGNFSVPVTWLQADALSATQIEQVARDIKAVGQLHALIEAASFFAYTASDGTYDVDVLGRVSAIAENSTIADYIDITLDEEYGRISNFRTGMRIDIVADSSGSIQTGTATDGSDVRNYTHTTAKYVFLIVHSVDYLSKKITLAPINSDTGTKPNYGSASSGDIFQAANPGAADDWLVLSRCSRYASGARPMMSWGLEDWIKSSGKLMGGAAAAEGLDLAYYPQFKSQVKTVSAPLTDDVLNRYIAGYLDAYPGQTLDTIITTQGVTQKYIQQTTLYNNRQVFDRTGKAVDIVGGWEEVKFSFNGRMFNWIISPMCLAKTLYGLKMAGGNIKRYVPPKVGGTDGRVDQSVEFLGPLSGHTGIFMAAGQATSATGPVAPMNLVQAPFWRYSLICPVDPKGVRLGSLTESTLT